MAKVSADIEEVHRSEDVTAKWAAMEAKSSAKTSVKKNPRVGLMCVRYLVWLRGDTMSEVGIVLHQEHEWMRVEGDTVTIGITDHAQAC